MEVENPTPRIFLLSPASTDGLRAQQLTSPRAGFGAAERYRSPEGVTIEEAFTFMSSLYFRGKIGYARHFAAPPPELALGSRTTASWSSLPASGWCRRACRITPEEMKKLRRTPVDLKSRAYCAPMKKHVEQLRDLAPDGLGGAPGQRRDRQVRGPAAAGPRDRLLFPRDFAGAGDMKRGGMMLRAVREDRELSLRHPRRAPPPRPRLKLLAGSGSRPQELLHRSRQPAQSRARPAQVSTLSGGSTSPSMPLAGAKMAPAIPQVERNLSLGTIRVAPEPAPEAALKVVRRQRLRRLPAARAARRPDLRDHLVLPQERGERHDAVHVLRMLGGVEERAGAADRDAGQPDVVVTLPRRPDHILAQAVDDRAVVVVAEWASTATMSTRAPARAALSGKCSRPKSSGLSRRPGAAQASVRGGRRHRVAHRAQRRRRRAEPDATAEEQGTGEERKTFPAMERSLHFHLGIKKHRTVGNANICQTGGPHDENLEETALRCC